MKKIIKLILFISLVSLAINVYASGLVLQFSNNTNTLYNINLSTKADYEDSYTFADSDFLLKPCDTSFISLTAHSSPTTWCGYDDGRVGKPGKGGYAVLSIKQINGNKPYAKVIVAVSTDNLSRDINYSETARDSTFHVHSTCTRQQDHDVCQVTLDE